ncbi:MAG: transporter substrate-binding domain-containing protein [Xanthobacteraceae bacterium]
MQNTLRIFIALAGTAIFAASSFAADDAALKELAPTGKLRVAVAVSPSPSALYVVKDSAGALKGVAVDLGAAMAKKLGVPVEYVQYLASGEITNAASTGVWDVTFMPYDAERAKFVQFGPAYHLLQSTYLVAPGSNIQTLADVNKPGMQIAGVANTATFRASAKSSPEATVVTVPGVDVAVDLMREGKADAITLSRESLSGLAAKLPGSRILDGGFMNSVTAVAVPLNKPAALAYVTAFIEDAKASGEVRRAFDAIGLTISMVAPAGMKAE